MELDEWKLENDHGVFLTSVCDDMQANIIESKLTANNIPVLRKYRGLGNYLSIYMGSTNLGIDLYVPSKLLDDAKLLIENNEGQDYSSKENMEISEMNKRYQRLRRTGAWLIILILTPGLIWFLVIFIKFILRLIGR